MQLQEILRLSSLYLQKNGFTDETARDEAGWLLAFALGRSRLDMPAEGKSILSEDQLAAIRPLLKRRAKGEPLQYILGSVPFHDIDILVGPGALIPRSETELLVEEARKLYPGQGEILDLCTGTGCIALALARACPQAPAITGVELSSEAIAWARLNRNRLGANNVYFVQGDLFAPVDGMRFSLITANPPYIGETERATLSRDVVAYEPAMALFAGPDGLDVLRRIIRWAPGYLQPQGYLLCEIGHTQGQAVSELFLETGLCEVTVRKDYAGHDRIVIGRRPAESARKSPALQRY